MKNLLKVLLVTAGALVAVCVIGVVVFSFLVSRNLYVPDIGPVPELVIRGGTLFDARTGVPTRNVAIIVRDGAIACIGPLCDAGDDATVVDARGLAIVPGLIDLHVHFFAITADNANLSMPRLIMNIARLRPDVRRKLLEAGVTSVRDVGGPQDAVLELKQMIEGGELTGPRVFASGPIFTAPGGHPAYDGRDPNTLGFGGNMTFQSDDPDAVRAEVKRLSARGFDGIKAVYQGVTADTGEIRLPTLSVETLRALVESARANGLWVAVHVGPKDEAGIAAELGATTVEHGVRMGHLVDDRTLRRLVASKVVYVPTLGREPKGHLNIAALHDAGVIIGVGTDTNNPEMSFGESYHQELERLVDAGLPPAAALVAATRNAAAGIAQSDELGTIETGKLADILIVRGEPWLDVGDLRKPLVVIQKGRIVVDNRHRDN